jgi:hypothetical protein
MRKFGVPASRCALLCDDDNDLELAAIVGKAFLPSIGAVSELSCTTTCAALARAALLAGGNMYHGSWKAVVLNSAGCMCYQQRLLVLHVYVYL